MPTIEELRELIRAGAPIVDVDEAKPAVLERHRFWVDGKTALAYEIDFDLVCDLDFSFTLFEERDEKVVLRVESDVDECADLGATFLDWSNGRRKQKEEVSALLCEELRTSPVNGKALFKGIASWSRTNARHHRMMDLLSHASTEWKMRTQEKVFWHHDDKNFLIYFPDKSLKTKPEKGFARITRGSLKWLKEPEVMAQLIAKKNWVRLDVAKECGLEKACQEILAEVHD